MQVFAYPTERADFVSRSGSAGSIFFGDSLSLCEEFFGPAHVKSGNEEKATISYFKESITLHFEHDALRSIALDVTKGSEKIDVYVEKNKLSTLSESELSELARVDGVTITTSPEGSLKCIELSAAANS